MASRPAVPPAKARPRCPLPGNTSCLRIETSQHPLTSSPARVPRIRFYNHYIEEADLNTSQFGPAGAAPDTSFLKVLPHAATKEDFVSVKLDIDGGPELELAYGIASRPELAELVDELFFE